MNISVIIKAKFIARYWASKSQRRITRQQDQAYRAMVKSSIARRAVAR